MPDASPSLARLTPGSHDVPSQTPIDQATLFLAFLALLEDLAKDRTIVLILEDLHWADRSTRDLLSFLAHNLNDQRLLVIASYRADQISIAITLCGRCSPNSAGPRMQSGSTWVRSPRRTSPSSSRPSRVSGRRSNWSPR